MLFCGLPGSGKTTMAYSLEKSGYVRYSLDEVVFEMFGKDPQVPLEPRQKSAKNKIIKMSLESLDNHKGIILDWGFWKEEERRNIRKLFCEHGKVVELWYFKNKLDVLIKRLGSRDQEVNHFIDADMMSVFAQDFEEPLDYDKLIV